MFEQNLHHQSLFPLSHSVQTCFFTINTNATTPLAGVALQPEISVKKTTILVHFWLSTVDNFGFVISVDSSFNHAMLVW